MVLDQRAQVSIGSLAGSTAADVARLRDAVESQHGGTAAFVQALRFVERFREKTVWKGVVHVFDVTWGSTTGRAYAWFSPVQGGAKRRSFTVLHGGSIHTPQSAVRATVVAGYRALAVPTLQEHALRRSAMLASWSTQRSG